MLGGLICVLEWVDKTHSKPISVAWASSSSTLPLLSPFPPLVFLLLPSEVKKGKGSPYSITERRVPELIPVLGSQPAGDVSHKPDGMAAVTFRQLPSQPFTGLLPISLHGEQRQDGCELFD